MRFSCTLCGDCCTGAQLVRLTGNDLLRLVARLGLTSINQLRSRGVVQMVREALDEGRFVWRPRLRFRTKPLVQCPFLLNEVDDLGAYHGLCSLHPHDKPLVCRLSPLTREVVDAGHGEVQEAWSLVAPVEGCPGVGRGDLLSPSPSQALRPDLVDEVNWMRFLVASSPSCPDEDSAWSLLARWKGQP